MSAIDFLLARWRGKEYQEAIIWHQHTYSYRWLSSRVSHWRNFLETESVQPGTVVLLQADFSPNAIAMLLALIASRCIIVLMTKWAPHERKELIEIAQPEVVFSISEQDCLSSARMSGCKSHELYEALRRADHPGLVLFSSGSTGRSKGVVHDFVPLLEKFLPTRKTLRTVSFLLFDHIGGLNTLFYTLSNCGCLIIPQERTPDSVLEGVEKFRPELLPVSPTFLNLILMSRAHERYDLSSLQTISYGTEPMSGFILRKFNELFPRIRFVQLYGLSEVGILHSKSKESDSTWVRLAPDETRVTDGTLQIKTKTAMIGYLNAPSPFTPDGWLMTGDAVEVDGEFLKILGRKSELINVGGKKVYPTEVESVVQEMDEVAEVSVYGEKSAIMGNIVCARVRLKQGAESDGFASRLRQFCRHKLQEFKVPVRVALVDSALHTQRFKKERQPEAH